MIRPAQKVNERIIKIGDAQTIRTVGSMIGLLEMTGRINRLNIEKRSMGCMDEGKLSETNFGRI